MNARDVIDAAYVAWCSQHGQDYRLADVILAALADDGWRVVRLVDCNDEFCTAPGELAHVIEEAS